MNKCKTCGHDEIKHFIESNTSKDKNGNWTPDSMCMLKECKCEQFKGD